ncbi:MAG: NAD(P)-dependent oxidoreductase [Xanthomonadales bacterium]|nr:NAD(P)-dependent oxidoreductase [Xanthomonadales bacterium]
MDNNTLRAGFIGLGAMGQAMARHLHGAGFLAAVWNRTAAKAGALAQELAVAAPETPAQLAQSCDVVFVCVAADADVLAVIQALEPGLQPGSLVVDTSTVSPATARTAAQRLAARGVGFVDAPVTGGVEGARNGTLSVLVGGGAADVERVRPLLASFGQRIAHFGAVGAGQAAKAVNQVMVAGIAEAVCEGLALAERLELDTDALIDTLGNGAAGSWFLQKRGRTMLADQFEGGFKLALLHKDLGIVQAIASELGAQLATTQAALADYGQLLADGHGDEEISALIRLKRRQVGSG